MNLVTRLCAVCGEWKPLDEFVRDRSKPGGHGSRCRRCDSERVMRYYRENREAILDKAAAKRGGKRLEVRTTCSECGELLKDGQRLTCGSRSCRDRRFKRTNPEGYAKREAAKVVRRREARRRAREAEAS